MLKHLIEQNDIISFDIFDTLIKRNIKKPTDIFELIEEVYDNSKKESSNFKKCRIVAEKKARTKSASEDITLNDIYNNFPEKYSPEQLLELKELEQNIEINMCVANKEIVEHFNYAKSLNKKIIIVSDMYLTKDVIERILIKNKITGYYKIYISSEHGLTKHTGNLFKFVFHENNFDNKKVLHIGDNIGSDIKQAKKIGINTFHIKDSGEGTLRKRINNKIEEHIQKENIYKNIIDELIKQNSNDKEKMYKYGYSVLGPILYGFLDYIHKESSEKNIEKIYFFARDGYLLKKAYENYYISKKKIPSSYLYVSRKSLVTPMIKQSDNIKEVFDKLGIKVAISVENFFERFLNDISTVDHIILRYYKSRNELIDINKDYERVNNLYCDSKEILFKQINNQKKLLVEYLLQEGFKKNKNVAVMDLGWRGSLQFNLINIIKEIKVDVNIFGYYLGLSNKYLAYRKKGMVASGYIFNPEDNYYENHILGGIGLVELMFTAPHGSVLGYKKEDDEIEPILDEIEYTTKQQNIINLIQKGALDFTKNISELTNNLNIDFKKELLIENFIKLISEPTLEEAKIFGDFTFYDYGESYLARPEKLRDIILNPKKAFSDFRKSNWKVGYMKRLGKLNIKYIKIYSTIRNSEIKK